MTFWAKSLLMTVLLGSSGGLIAGGYVLGKPNSHSVIDLKNPDGSEGLDGSSASNEREKDQKSDTHINLSNGPQAKSSEETPRGSVQSRDNIQELNGIEEQASPSSSFEMQNVRGESIFEEVDWKDFPPFGSKKPADKELTLDIWGSF